MAAGETEAHGAKAPGTDERTRPRELVELGRPHLVLADLGGDDGLALGQPGDDLHHVLGLDLVRRGGIGQRLFGLPGGDALQPGRADPGRRGGRLGRGRFQALAQGGEEAFAIGHHRDVHGHVFLDRGGVDVDVHDLGVFGELADLARDPVVEPAADGQNQVGVADGHVGGIGAVHAEHADPERIVGRETAQGHERGRDRDVEGPGQPEQFLVGAGSDDPAAGVNDGFLGAAHHLRHLGHLLGVGGVGGVVAAHLDGFRIMVFGHGPLDVLGQVDEHRARPAGGGQIEGLLDDPGQIPHVLDQIVVLGAGAGDADDVHFLEGVVADQRGGHLAGDDDHRHRVHVGGGDAGYGIGGSGARGHQAYADLARGPGIAVRGMDGSLFVPYQHMTQGVARQLIVNVDDRPSRKAEYDFHAFAAQGFQKDLGPGAFHAIFPPPCDISSATSRSASFRTASFS